MIERIAVAERQYERIMLDVISRSNPQAWIDFPVREIKAWLQDDVVPLIDQFRLGPMFRDHASWTLKTLVAGSVSVERRAVEATDRARWSPRQACFNWRGVRWCNGSSRNRILRKHGRSQPRISSQRTLATRSRRDEHRWPMRRENHVWLMNCRSDRLQPGQLNSEAVSVVSMA